MTHQHDEHDPKNRAEGPDAKSGPSAPPELFTAEQAAAHLHVSGTWLRQQLRARHFSGVKIAGRWYMTGDQITEAIAFMTSPALPPEPVSPAGLARNSRFRRRANLKSVLPPP
ncbi:helix-turn-helix domain-containing protein [[Mycobacterium] zoologicum]|uniref:helix-turn-helix domain-containing protein n=1 Tax=[Mycobacterium] zoologicum TaxID=2872311 RepID=UPI001CDA752C|nr:helix-turn-helix domain-containing protein [Mycolicibacter sp. MYC101]MEB3062474.1 helix-turn-helix domain-containing protein [Mycolicibacter sp. MYC101]